ncbi:HAD hydrolase family protein [Lacrimispora sp. 38-1]
MDYHKIALFSDLDGTLFNSHTAISPETIAAVSKSLVFKSFPVPMQ